MKYVVSILTLCLILYGAVQCADSLRPIEPKTFETLREAREYLRKCKNRGDVQRISLNSDNSFTAMCLEARND